MNRDRSDRSDAEGDDPSAPAPLPDAAARGLSPLDVLATLRQPFLVLDADLRVRSASPAFFLAFGLAADETIGRRIYDLGEGEWSTPAVVELLEEIAPTRELVEDHELVIGQGAAARVSRVNLRPVRSGANRLEFHLLSFDVAPSSSQASPTVVLRDEPLLRQLAADHIADVVALYDGQGACLYVGEACEAIFGHSRAEWMQLPAWDLFHPADRAAVDALLGTATSRRGGKDALRLRRATGEWAWVEVVVRPVTHPERGRLAHVTVQDVTQRRRAEEALRWLSRQTKLILDSAAEGIVGIDPQGRVTFANPAAMRMLGGAPGDVMGGPYSRFCGAEATEEITATLRDGQTRGGSAREFMRLDGSGFPAEFICNPARQQGEVVGAVVTFRDVSDRLQGTGPLLRALQHEIDAPVSALLAAARRLEQEEISLEQRCKAAASIAAEAGKIQRSVQRLTHSLPGASGAEGDGETDEPLA